MRSSRGNDTAFRDSAVRMIEELRENPKMSEEKAEKPAVNFLEALMGMEESIREFREAAEIASAAMRVRKEKGARIEEIHGVVIVTSEQWQAIKDRLDPA